VHHLITVMGVSERFACRVTGQPRTTQRHQAHAQTPADPDAGLRQWLRDYAKKHPRRGFRPAHDARAEAGSSIIRSCNDPEPSAETPADNPVLSHWLLLSGHQNSVIKLHRSGGTPAPDTPGRFKLASRSRGECRRHQL
jgi:hypothetical protein